MQFVCVVYIGIYEQFIVYLYNNLYIIRISFNSFVELIKYLLCLIHEL